jgi:2-oxoglutarate dehydrogenase E1 component
MCAEENMIAAMPSSPASYFHLLRRQAFARPRRPLIVFTPKSMLRLRDAQSGIEEFSSGTFREVIPDVKTPDQMNPAGVTRVLMCAGKIYYDLAAEREKLGDTTTAIVRLEQFYPLNGAALKEAIAPFGDAELIWVQEEPENQGAWSHLSPAIYQALKRTFGVISRPASASPASGMSSKHALQQQDVVERAFARS